MVSAMAERHAGGGRKRSHHLLRREARRRDPARREAKAAAPPPMTTAISTSDPNTDRVGGWLGWAIQAPLLRSTSVRVNLPFQCVMTSPPKICSIRRPSIFDRKGRWSPGRDVVMEPAG